MSRGWGKRKKIKLNRSIKNGFIDTIYNSQDMGATEMSINRWMDKERCGHLYVKSKKKKKIQINLFTKQIYRFWKLESDSCSVMSDSLPTRFLCLWNSPGKNTGVDCHSLLQGIFLTGIKPRSPALQADSLPSEPPGKLPWKKTYG